MQFMHNDQFAALCEGKGAWHLYLQAKVRPYLGR